MDAAALLSWFDASARDLPWRREPRDPYAVWVSEVMLQQTRVETALRHFGPFLACFPDVASLARADDDALMKAWEGLGYYRRARLLRDAARVLVALHDGRLPRDAGALRTLPGVGAYTAGAVASLAFGLREVAVDGNVERVVARQSGLYAPQGSTRLRQAAAAWVRAHQPHARPGPFNEALMELGATLCTPRAPRCGACPVRATCAGRDRAAALPAPRPRARVETEARLVAVARRGETFLLEKRGAGLLEGTWGLPSVAGEDADALARHVSALTGGAVRVGGTVARARHAFTHRRWAMEARLVDVTGEGGAWRRLDEVALATADRRVLARLG